MVGYQSETAVSIKVIGSDIIVKGTRGAVFVVSATAAINFADLV